VDVLTYIYCLIIYVCMDLELAERRNTRHYAYAELVLRACGEKGAGILRGKPDVAAGILGSISGETARRVLHVLSEDLCPDL